jgi:hypothetical protein
MLSFDYGPDNEMAPNAANYSEMPLTHGIMVMPWYTVSEGWFLLSYFITG